MISKGYCYLLTVVSHVRNRLKSLVTSIKYAIPHLLLLFLLFLLLLLRTVHRQTKISFLSNPEMPSLSRRQQRPPEHHNLKPNRCYRQRQTEHVLVWCLRCLRQPAQHPHLWSSHQVHQSRKESFKRRIQSCHRKHRSTALWWWLRVTTVSWPHRVPRITVWTGGRVTKRVIRPKHSVTATSSTYRRWFRWTGPVTSTKSPAPSRYGSGTVVSRGAVPSVDARSSSSSHRHSCRKWRARHQSMTFRVWRRRSHLNPPAPVPYHRRITGFETAAAYQQWMIPLKPL